MHEDLLAEIVEEMTPVLRGRTLGRSFQLGPLTLAFDLRPYSGNYLFISVEPNRPRLYLIKRKLRDLEKLSIKPSQFLLRLQKAVSHARLLRIIKIPDERIVHFIFEQLTRADEAVDLTLVAQLTGRSANLLLLDKSQRIFFRLRSERGEQVREIYRAPERSDVRPGARPFTRGSLASISEAADNYYQQLEAEQAFKSRVKAALTRLRKETTQLYKLRQNLLHDLEGHGDPEAHKKIGDLILANLSSAVRHGEKVIIKDYYIEGAPEVEVRVDQNRSLAEEADRYFVRYSKAKKAQREISQRLEAIDARLSILELKRIQFDEAIAENARDLIEKYLAEYSAGEISSTSPAKKDKTYIAGVRRFLSSDGFEILVGRNSKDNDNLTFRIARPNDTWLHCADYPGSHVIIRHQKRGEVPQRTIIEAAQLAAKFSRASGDLKVDIHYTERKFLSKPKGAAPGLVRLSRFKTMTVTPGEAAKRII